MKKALFILLLAFCFLSCRSIEKEKFVLPLNYEGPAIVIFDQNDGNKKQYDDDGYRLYEIGNNGVCKTQFKTQAGEIIKKFVYKKTDESLQELKNLEYDSAEDIYQNLEDPNVLQTNQIYTANWGNLFLNDIYSVDFITGKSKDTINTLYVEYYSPNGKIYSLYESVLNK